MSKFIIIFYSITLIFSHWAWGNCQGLKSQLASMQRAQQIISQNLYLNYKDAAETGLKTRSLSAQSTRVVFLAHSKRAQKTEAILKKLDNVSKVLIKKSSTVFITKIRS